MIGDGETAHERYLVETSIQDRKGIICGPGKTLLIRDELTFDLNAPCTLSSYAGSLITECR